MTSIFKAVTESASFFKKEADLLIYFLVDYCNDIFIKEQTSSKIFNCFFKLTSDKSLRKFGP